MKNYLMHADVFLIYLFVIYNIFYRLYIVCILIYDPNFVKHLISKFEILNRHHVIYGR